MTRSALAFAWIVALSAASFAAKQDQQQTPTFRSRVDLVHFDVSVLDKDRRPIRGLTATDFTILEDGKPQAIAAFSAIDVPPPAPAPPAKWMREVSVDVQTNEPEQNPEGRLFVLLIDDAMLPGDPAAVQNAKKIARGVVDRLSPVDQVAVVFTFASRGAQTFTTDRTKLLTAIDSFKTGAASHFLGWDNPLRKDPRNPATWKPAVDSDDGLRLGSLRTLQMVADTLVTAPQRRKALIFISPGITVDIESAARPVYIPVGDPGTAIREANLRLTREMPEILGRMARANVTMYAIDPCGFDGLRAYITTSATGLDALRSGSDPSLNYNWLAPDRPPRPAALAQHMATVSMDFLVAAAANTGGRPIVNTNDFEPGLDGIFLENGSYYLIAYARPDKNPPGSLHRVTVKVNRPDVTVRTRSGYETDPEPAPEKNEPIKSALDEAAAGPVANGKLPLQIALAPVVVPAGHDSKESSAAVTVVLGLREPSVRARARQTIELQLSVFTPDGRRLMGPLRQTAAFTLVPGSEDLSRYEVLTQVALKPGRYELRVAAHRASDNLSGSVYADVVVPDFSKEPLSLSGVWLESNPGPSPITRDALRSIVPVVPTASREFGKRDDVTALLRVYQGGDRAMLPVSLAVQIVNERDATVATATGTLGPERFDAATRAADHRFVLPLQALPPGRYLLRFDVTRGEATARRDVVFEVGFRK